MKDINVAIFTGRLTADPEVSYLSNGTAKASFNLAVNRSFVKKDDQNAPTADFIRCQCFGNSAKFVEQYMKKGARTMVRGHIQTGKYVNKNNVTVYTTDLIVEDVGFGESRGSSDGSGASNGGGNNASNNNYNNNANNGFSGGYQNTNGGMDFINVPPGVDANLPFN